MKLIIIIFLSFISIKSLGQEFEILYEKIETSQLSKEARKNPILNEVFGRDKKSILQLNFNKEKSIQKNIPSISNNFSTNDEEKIIYVDFLNKFIYSQTGFKDYIIRDTLNVIWKINNEFQQQLIRA